MFSKSAEENAKNLKKKLSALIDERKSVQIEIEKEIHSIKVLRENLLILSKEFRKDFIE